MTLAVDNSGVLAANLISAEAYATQDLYNNTFSVLFPTEGPFYQTGLTLHYTPTGWAGAPFSLVLGVDYSLALPMPGILVNANQVYGAISILNANLNGALELTYQALGGAWVYNPLQIRKYLEENYYNLNTQDKVLVPNPDIYPAFTGIDLTSFANITASLALISPISLGMAYATKAVWTNLP